MELRVVGVVEGRFETRLATVDDHTAIAATDRAVIRWDVAGDRALTDTVVHVSDDDHPGPLAWLASRRSLVWGPTLLTGDGPAWATAALLDAALGDLGPGAAKRFHLVAGAVSGDGRHVGLVVEKLQSKVVASQSRQTSGPPHRVCVVDATTMKPGRTVEGITRTPTVVGWADGPLLIGMPGQVVVYGGQPLVLGDGTAPRSLATSPLGTVTAGTAGGRIYTRSLEWTAHDGPVTAMAWAPDDRSLATGGSDGRLRTWSSGGGVGGEIDLGGEVDAVTWLHHTALVAKAGGQGGRLSLVRLA